MYFCTDMSVLENFVPKIALPFLEKWFGDHICHLKITPNRQSKLGDYRLLPDGSHQISVNGTLDSELFFLYWLTSLLILFLFTKKKILPHGKEWKSTFRNMLLDSILVYSNELQPIIRDFSKALKPILCRVRIWLNISIKEKYQPNLCRGFGGRKLFCIPETSL